MGSSPVFEPLTECAQAFSKLRDWPGLESFRAAFQRRGLETRPVAQGGRPGCLAEHYEPRIFLRGELQTRLRNWHDFFNALVWLRFPATKAALNRQHYHAARLRAAKTNRSPLENKLARFDECGAVVISDSSESLELIRSHQWRTLFWDQRQRFNRHIRCFVFGHATFEKALNPYPGMSTNTLLLHAPSLLTASYEVLDQWLADYWQAVSSADDIELRPFPIFGIPGWDKDNAHAGFYDNTRYFLPARPHPSGSDQA